MFRRQDVELRVGISFGENEDENLEIFQQKIPKTYQDDLKT